MHKAMRKILNENIFLVQIGYLVTKALPKFELESTSVQSVII